ncbi:hypothetical protein GCM10009678_73150 [Actinomadura kijaniata]|uniref:Dyp-type peroxidase family n=1 Tax=Actinomadura namibiensis TaxID=182080 RepID=A0A7W3QSB8_ACTNM|nr:Dyp-type peroxidase [Actinomadura namibiensis]MBA8957566.1 Dyp-type peroxidase family [Actinomadura namibiensis]
MRCARCPPSSTTGSRTPGAAATSSSRSAPTTPRSSAARSGPCAAGTPGTARLRWTQQGFLGTFGDATPRNLFGHKDGTANPRPGDTGFDAAVWADPAREPAWFAGGTYLVFRKIRMDLPTWDTSPGHAQDQTIGRRRDDGAPLSGGHEFTAPDLTRTGPDGKPLIPADSHVALVRDIPMLRRSYNYDYGLRADTAPATDHRHGDHRHDHGPGMPARSGSGHARYDSGTLFCAYLRDPAEFVRAQRALAADRLNAFIQHTGSAVFAVPPGVPPAATSPPDCSPPADIQGDLTWTDATSCSRARPPRPGSASARFRRPRRPPRRRSASRARSYLPVVMPFRSVSPSRPVVGSSAVLEPLRRHEPEIPGVLPAHRRPSHAEPFSRPVLHGLIICDRRVHAVTA